MAKVFIVVGHNQALDNISARAAYSTRKEADKHVQDKARMWFDDRADVIELEVDSEIPEF